MSWTTYVPAGDGADASVTCTVPAPASSAAVQPAQSAPFTSTFAPASTGNIWVVPKSAKNKDLAYDFIDITLSKDNQALLGNSGGLPIATDPAAITDPVGHTEVTLFNQLIKQNGLGFYPDWPVPGFYDVVLQGTEAVIAGTATPEQFAERLKKAYDDVQTAQ